MIDHAACDCWINGQRYDDLIENPTVGDLRLLANVPDDHDFFAEDAADDEHRLALSRAVGQDVKLDDSHRTIHLSVLSRFYSTPRYINAG